MRPFLVFFLVIGFLLGYSQQEASCDSLPEPMDELRPSMERYICWADWELPNQKALLSKLLPKVKGKKVPGLYVMIDEYDSVNGITRTEEFFSPDHYDTATNAYAFAGTLHALDYNKDGKPDIIACNRRPQSRSDVTQFWRNNGDSLELELTLNGYIARMTKDQNGSPDYFWLHNRYCCAYSIVHLMQYKNVNVSGRYTFQLHEKWIYFMNEYMQIPRKFDLHSVFRMRTNDSLYMRKKYPNNYIRLDKKLNGVSEAEIKRRLFIPVARIGKGASGIVLATEWIDGEEWHYVIFDRNTGLLETTFDAIYMTNYPKEDIPRIRYLGYVKKKSITLP